MSSSTWQQPGRQRTRCKKGFIELLLNYNKQLLSLQEKEIIFLHRQTSRNNLVNVMIKGATSEASPVQLYLAAGESDQATSGHIFLDNLRTLMRGLPTDIPIMACEDIHAVFTKGAPLQCDVNDLFQKAFTTGSELVVWPGINNSKEDRILLLVLRARLWCLEEPEDQNLALCGQEAFCNWHNLSFLCGSDRSCNVGGDNPLQKEILDITGAIVSGNTASMVSL